MADGWAWVLTQEKKTVCSDEKTLRFDLYDHSFKGMESSLIWAIY